MRDMKHGTRGPYRKGCRCDACVKFARLYQAEWRARKKLREAVANSEKFPSLGETVYSLGGEDLGRVSGYVLSQDLVVTSSKGGKMWIPFAKVKSL